MLPLHLGWRRSTEVFQEQDLFDAMDALRNVTNGILEAAPAVRQ